MATVGQRWTLGKVEPIEDRLRMCELLVEVLLGRLDAVTVGFIRSEAIRLRNQVVGDTPPTSETGSK